MADKRVFLDTNVIIECFCIGVWSELSQGYRLETVDEVVTEAMTGITSRPDRVAVDRTLLLAGLAQQPHSVTRKDRNGLLRHYPSMATLDPGELNLFAYLNSHELPLAPLIVIGTADKGAIAAARLPGWLDQLVSLEELLKLAKVSRAKLDLVGSQHTVSFLSEVRTKVFFGIIP
ncbi:MAG: hypothetical protein WA191_18110 [Telluria sp.]